MIKTQDLVDPRFLDEIEKSGFSDKFLGKGLTGSPAYAVRLAS
jgi:hypothetical protein